ncbi:alpha-hydroxy-acid oxidizing protein, partial [Klebsiella pneumoniae]
MIVSAPSDYREAARRRLPRFLFDYIDGGAVAENTMNANAAELASVALRQRVLCGAGEPTLATTILEPARPGAELLRHRAGRRLSALLKS